MPQLYSIKSGNTNLPSTYTFQLSSDMPSTPELTITLGTEVTKGTAFSIEPMFFDYRFKDTSFSSKANRNPNAGPINLIIGEGFASGANNGNVQNGGTFRVTVDADYNSEIITDRGFAGRAK